MTYDLIVVGDGLAARVFLYNLNKCVKSRNSQIPNVLVISDNQSFAPCSLNSTATISTVGLQEGVGEHGDLLLRAYREFEDFTTVLPEGIVTKSKHYQVFMGDDLARFEGRYGEAINLGGNLRGAKGDSYLARPQALLEFLLQGSRSHLNIINSLDAVIALDHQGLIVTARGRLQAKRVLIAAGAAGEELLADTRDFGSSPKVGESIFGSYLEWECDNPCTHLGSSWQLGLSKFNVIYRELDQRLLLGGTTTKSVHCFHPIHMKTQYELAQQLLEGALPSFQSAAYRVGERSKLAGRRPFWGKVAGQTYAIRGFYKNGYTLAFLAARGLMELEDFAY